MIWTNKAVAFMRDAAAYCNFYGALAEKLMDYLPQEGHVCDAGCGIGLLAIELAKRCRRVTAVDLSETAIAALRESTAQKNLYVCCTDILTMQPNPRYDAMVFCYYGKTEEILRIAKRQCAGRVAIVKRNCEEHRFSIGRVASPNHTGGQTAELLRKMNIPFVSERLEMEFGQPFRRIEDALEFFALYNQSDQSVTAEAVERRLVQTKHTAFPLYLPELRRMELYVLNASDIPL